MPLNLFYTMVQKSQKWPKTQIKGGGGSCLKEGHSFSQDEKIKVQSSAHAKRSWIHQRKILGQEISFMGNYSREGILSLLVEMGWVGGGGGGDRYSRWELITGIGRYGNVMSFTKLTNISWKKKKKVDWNYRCISSFLFIGNDGDIATLPCLVMVFVPCCVYRQTRKTM